MLERSTIQDEVTLYIQREFLAGTGNERLDPNQSLVESGIIESIGLFLVIGFLEEHFGVKVEPEDMVVENFETVAAIEELVQRKTRA